MPRSRARGRTDIRGFARLRALVDRLRTSFWFVPILMLTLGFPLALIATRLDDAVAQRSEFPLLLYVSEQATAREILATILSSMITMASLVFSITMVVLTLAAGQFGPRLIRSFMASLHTQAVLGTYAMTIVYCLLALVAVGSRAREGLHAYPTVTMAVILTIVSITLLVVHLHLLARSIMSETVIERVGAELDALTEALPADDKRDVPPSRHPAGIEEEAVFFGTRTAGYVKAVEFRRLCALAAKADRLVVLRFRPGDYVACGGRDIGVSPPARLDADLVEAIQDTIIVGTHRTPLQDPDFAIRHLVEIAVRALSPGVNDPYTAVSVVNRLSASLVKLMRRTLPDGLHHDEGGSLRVIAPAPDWDSLLSAGFDQIRQNGADKPAIAIHLLEAFARMAEQARLPRQQEAIARQIEIVEAAALARIELAHDREAVSSRADRAREALAQMADRR
jgi:uncharacterized membrane protein